MYWEITPHHSGDVDKCVVPAGTIELDRAALKYAKDRLEDAWDAAVSGKPMTVKIELCEGPMPETENE